MPRERILDIRVKEYHDYTPFNMSLADLYKEVKQTERFPKPKALQVRADANKSLFYEYHTILGTR